MAVVFSMHTNDREDTTMKRVPSVESKRPAKINMDDMTKRPVANLVGTTSMHWQIPILGPLGLLSGVRFCRNRLKATANSSQTSARPSSFGSL